jgi:hypothetical protein
VRQASRLLDGGASVFGVLARIAAAMAACVEREDSGGRLENLLLGRWGRGKGVTSEANIPASSSLNRADASRGVSGGVSTPLSCGIESSLLGGMASVVVNGVVGSAGAGTGAVPPKK